MEQWAQRDSRVHVIRNTELPAGWTGKTHAMRMGTQAATGEILLFSDADATFTPDGLERALTYFVDNDLDMLSLIPGFEERSFNEDAVYLHLALGFASCLPMSKVNDPADPAGIASGCFIMISMDAYERIGTWERFRTEITEDVAMSRALKAAGMRMRVLRGADLVRTKPFTSVREVARFWTRTLYGGLEKNLHKVLMLAGNYLALTIVFALFAWSAIQWWGGHASFWELLLFLTSGVASVAVIVPTMVLIRRERSHWILNGIVSPIGIVVSMGIALQAAYAIVTGKGIAWRGSLYK
jgi:cellulose synthase/poly-beta-1,6-N-acetylglucosamine synthase-like glycosyltransferase